MNDVLIKLSAVSLNDVLPEAQYHTFPELYTRFHRVRGDASFPYSRRQSDLLRNAIRNQSIIVDSTNILSILLVLLLTDSFRTACVHCCYKIAKHINQLYIE